MKMATSQDPIRLRDIPAGQDVSGVGAAELFREACNEPRLGDAELELAARRARAISRRPRWRRLRLAFSLTSLPVLLFGVTVGAATTAVLGWRWAMPVAPPQAAVEPIRPLPPPAPARRHRAHAPAPPMTLLKPEAHLQSSDPPSDSGGGARALASPPPSTRSRRRLAPTQPAVAEPEPASVAVAEDPLAPPAADAPQWALPPSQEVQLLRQAVRALRTESRPAVALDLLQDFSVRFANSNLKPEADWLQVEAHMRLGQQSDALALLNRMDTQPRRLSPAAAVLRAELLAGEGRCDVALPVFSGVIRQGGGGDTQERALYGHAVCLARVGDAASARAAYEEYNRRYPKGRFAQSVRRALMR